MPEGPSQNKLSGDRRFLIPQDDKENSAMVVCYFPFNLWPSPLGEANGAEG